MYSFMFLFDRLKGKLNEIQETQTLLTLYTCKHWRIQECFAEEIKTLASFTIKSSFKIRKPIQLQICNAINMHAFPNKVKSKSHQTKIHSAGNQNVVLTNGIKLTPKQKWKTKCTTHQTKLRITTYIRKCDKGYRGNENKMKPNSWNTK